MKTKIGIIGAGSLGAALAYLLSQNNNHINIYDINQKNIAKLLKYTKKRQRSNLFPVQSLPEVINNSEYLIPCLPSEIVDFFYNALLPIYKQQKIISVSKGFYQNSLLTISQKVTPWITQKNFAVFSGPTFAHEIINKEPTSAIIATINPKNTKTINQIFTTQYFNPISTKYVLETEFGGILKNCYAICFGLLERAGLGMNTKSLCLDKILKETKSFYQKNKLHWQAIYQISFLGDLIATSYNTKSRNFQFGKNLQHQQKITVEGELNIKPILSIAKKIKIKMPILETTEKIISNPNDFSRQINNLKKVILS